MSNQLPDKLYYGIGEVSKHFGVSQSLLRFWEGEFSFLRPKRNKKGTRFYSKKEIQQIDDIYRLVKIKGFTLQGAREVFIKNKKKGSDHEGLKKELLSIKEDLQKLKSQLKK